MDEPIRLNEGRWEGAPYAERGASAPRAGLVEDFILTGDLDGDADEEAVVLLWSSSGGSGTFDYLAVLDRDAAGTVINRAAVPLGDRVGVRSGRILNGRVVVETVQTGPEDAACCPGQKMKRTFALEGNAMVETSTEDQGRLSLADLAGQWKLVQFDNGGALPEDVRITAQFQHSQISGRAACNRYTGNVQEGSAPGQLALSGALAVTRMMCPPPLMEWEQRYLAALQGLTNYSFRAGRLVLTWRVDDAMGTLVFEPAAPG
jgi:heat shock protein HslJ